MAPNSSSTIGNNKAQNEALIQEADQPECKISIFAIIWRAAALFLIPLAFTLVTAYFGFSWSGFFQNKLNTASWLYTGYYGQASSNWMCLPNGKAVPRLLKVTPQPTVWDTSQFLDITFGFGSFNFGVAKGIDVGWDLIVGRGGQILLALFSYRIWSAILLLSMETHAVSFYTYTAVGFDRGPIFIIWASLRDLWAGRSQERLIPLMGILTSLYLLVFPTFVSTMTGYKPTPSPWVLISKENGMYPAEKILPVAALIRDGSRIGLTDDFPVAFAPYPDGCSYCDASETNLTELFYSWKYGSRDSTFILNGNTISLPSPKLNVTEFEDEFWMHGNNTYTRNDMHGICQPEKTYQWGFSFLALMVFCVITTLYAFSMYVLWLKIFLNSRKHRAGQRLGLFRAAMDFANALNAQAGEDCANKTEKQLADLVGSHKLGISCDNVDELPGPRVKWH